MPTRKQRRRQAKEKRHEYEFVYVDSEGNELDEVPDELAEEAPKQRRESRNGDKPAAKKSARPQQRGGRTLRVPPAPSWQRAFKRSALLGVFVLILFSFSAKGNLVRVIPLAVLFTLAYVPLMYYLDRFAYRRWQARQDAPSSASRPAKKR